MTRIEFEWSAELPSQTGPPGLPRPPSLWPRPRSAEASCTSLLCVTHTHESPHDQTSAHPSRLERLNDASLYLCTGLQEFIDRKPHEFDPEQLSSTRLTQFFRACFRGGVDIIQVRDKKVSAQTELAALRILVSVARAEGGLAAANDRADLAALAGVDVFHVGQTDVTPRQARQVLGPDILIGRSCHTTDHVTAALEDSDVDYYCTGPIWETPTKPGRAAVGLELPAFAAEHDANKPFFAIGGITAENLGEVLAAGASRVVVVRAITEADDPQEAAATLSERLCPLHHEKHSAATEIH